MRVYGCGMSTITGNDLEQAALSWLANLDWQVLRGPDIAARTAPSPNSAAMAKWS
jgi:hypothetical protein